MPRQRVFSDIRLVNGSTGDPLLFVDYPSRDDALLFDAGDNGALSLDRLADLGAVFLTHHHIDHFVGFDRVLRAVVDRDKTVAVYGPEGTIRKVYDRIKAYEFQHFPFQKLVLAVHELLPNRMRSAVLECERRFPEPEITENGWTTPTVFENTEVRVEAALVEHTVPCVAYAFVEKPGWHFDTDRLERSSLRWGNWVGAVNGRLQSGEAELGTIDIDGGTFAVADLAKKYFRRTRGARIGYVVDTAWTDHTREVLPKLVQRANRLYCDSFYLEREAKSAAKHRHMTARRAAELANLARVDELFLIHFAQRYRGRYEKLVAEARETFPNVRADFPSDS